MDGLPGVQLHRLGIRRGRTACPMTAHHESPAALFLCARLPAPVKTHSVPENHGHDVVTCQLSHTTPLSLVISFGVWSSYACNQ